MKGKPKICTFTLKVRDLFVDKRQRTRNKTPNKSVEMVKKHRKVGVPAILLRASYTATGCPVLKDKVLLNIFKEKKKTNYKKTHNTRERAFLIILQ